MREAVVKLLQRMSAWLMDPALSLDERYEMMRDMAYIAVVFATGKRCDNLANLDPSDGKVPGWERNYVWFSIWENLEGRIKTNVRAVTR